MKAGIWLAGLVVVFGLGSCDRGREGREAGPEAPGPEETAAHVLAAEEAVAPTGTVRTIVRTLEVSDAMTTREGAGGREVGRSSLKRERRMTVEVRSETEQLVSIERDRSSSILTTGEGTERSPDQPEPLEGLRLVFRLGDGGWTAVTPEEITDPGQLSAIEGLAAELGGREDVQVFGVEPRTIGESWEVDPEAISVLEEGRDLDGEYRLRFDRVEEFRGEPCAILLGNLNVNSESQSGPLAGAQLEVQGRVTIFRSLEKLETLRMMIEGDLVMTQTSGPGSRVTLRGPMKVVREVEREEPEN